MNRVANMRAVIPDWPTTSQANCRSSAAGMCRSGPHHKRQECSDQKNQCGLQQPHPGRRLDDAAVFSPLRFVLVVNKNSRRRGVQAEIHQGNVAGNLGGDDPEAKLIRGKVVQRQGR